VDASVAEWLACWTQAQKARIQIAAATLSGNSLRQTVHTHRASVHQAGKLKTKINENQLRRIACGERHKAVECPSVRPSVCPVDRQAGGFAAEVGRRCRSIAAAAAPIANRVNFGPTVKSCNILITFITDNATIVSALGQMGPKRTPAATGHYHVGSFPPQYPRNSDSSSNAPIFPMRGIFRHHRTDRQTDTRTLF